MLRRDLLAPLLPAFLATAAILGAAACRPPAPDPAADRAALLQQSAAWDQAIVGKNLAAIAGNMAEDFRQIASNGDVADKAAFLREITSADLVIEPYGVEDLDVRLYGDAALLSGHTHMKGSYQGIAFATHYRYIDVYARQGGVWKIVSVQITTIPPPPAANGG